MTLPAKSHTLAGDTQRETADGCRASVMVVVVGVLGRGRRLTPRVGAPVEAPRRSLPLRLGRKLPVVPRRVGQGYGVDDGIVLTSGYDLVAAAAIGEDAALVWV